MWPHNLGSVQPLRAAPVRVRKVSASAPQLTTAAAPSVPQPQDTSCPSSGPKPQACVEPLMTPDQLRKMATLPDDRAMAYLADRLPPDIPRRHAACLAVLLYTVFRWAGKNEMHVEKTSALVTVYFDAYKFFNASPWRTQGQVYEFVKESLLRLSVDRVPLSRRVLTPAECRGALLLCCRTCLPVLPLLRMALAPNHRLQLVWTPHERLLDVQIL